MKVNVNKIVNFIVITIMLATVVGCSNTNTKTSAGTNTGNQQMMEFPDLRGEIKEVVGNEITLKEIKQEPRPSGYPRPSGDPGSNGYVRPTGNPGGGTYGGPNGGNGMPTSPPVQYTGKEVTIIVPVGMSVVEGTFTPGSGMTETAVDISKLKKGGILEIYYLDDKTTIKKIVSSTGFGRGFRGGGMPDGFVPPDGVGPNGPIPGGG